MIAGPRPIRSIQTFCAASALVSIDLQHRQRLLQLPPAAAQVGVQQLLQRLQRGLDLHPRRPRLCRFLLRSAIGKSRNAPSRFFIYACAFADVMYLGTRRSSSSTNEQRTFAALSHRCDPCAPSPDARLEVCCWFDRHLQLLQPRNQALQLRFLGGSQLRREVGAQLCLQVPDLSLQRLRCSLRQAAWNVWTRALLCATAKRRCVWHPILAQPHAALTRPSAAGEHDLMILETRAVHLLLPSTRATGGPYIVDASCIQHAPPCLRAVSPSLSADLEGAPRESASSCARRALC